MASASFGSLKYEPMPRILPLMQGSFRREGKPVVEPLKHEPLVDAVDHLASLLAGRVETEVHQNDETVEGNKQASVLLRQIVSPPAGAPAPVASRRLAGEKLGSPAFGCDT